MSFKKITLNNLYDLLGHYIKEYGDKELINIGTSNKGEYLFLMGTDNAWTKLPIPAYKEDYNKNFLHYTTKQFIPGE